MLTVNVHLTLTHLLCGSTDKARLFACLCLRARSTEAKAAACWLSTQGELLTLLPTLDVAVARHKVPERAHSCHKRVKKRWMESSTAKRQ